MGQRKWTGVYFYAGQSVKTLLRHNVHRLEQREEGTYISEDQSRKGRLACPHQILQSSKPGADGGVEEGTMLDLEVTMGPEAPAPARRFLLERCLRLEVVGAAWPLGDVCSPRGMEHEGGVKKPDSRLTQKSY